MSLSLSMEEEVSLSHALWVLSDGELAMEVLVTFQVAAPVAVPPSADAATIEILLFALIVPVIFRLGSGSGLGSGVH